MGVKNLLCRAFSTPLIFIESKRFDDYSINKCDHKNRHFCFKYSVNIKFFCRNRITQAKHVYTNAKYFLKEVSGNHPYLLQVATVILISAYRDKEENPIENTRIVFFEQAEEMLMNILEFWSPRLCEAFILVAQKLDVSNFRREIKELNRQGFIKQENEQWQVSSSVFADLAKNKTVQEACKQTHTIN